MRPLRGFLLLAAALLLHSAAAQTAGNRFLIVLIGPTGSGKTTQSEFLARKYGATIISMEDLLKQNPDALARYQENGINSGPPQDNPALDSLVAGRLATLDPAKGVVLDRYPATKDQADHLTVLVKKLHLPAPIIVQIDVPDDVVRQRLARRKREDDTPERIEQRLKDYHRELDMVRAYYPQANIWTIDGTKSPGYVSDTIQSLLEDQLRHRKR